MTLIDIQSIVFMSKDPSLGSMEITPTKDE
jgi:hypothetical protein